MPLVLVQPGVIKKNSTEYFAVCGLAGILSCGLTHTLTTPIDMVKCNQQNNPQLFNKGFVGNLRFLGANKGIAGLTRGWAPTFVGYSFQGLGKFGLNDFFKYKYGQLLGEDFRKKNPRVFYAICSGSAEIFADILLCPWENVKIKVQTVGVPEWFKGTSGGYAKGLRDGAPRLLREEGMGGAFSILKPLWARQIPYTIIKFVAFEDFIRRIYGLTESQMGRTRESFNKAQQLGFTFLAGYGAGVFCAIATQPADTLASLVSKDPTTSIAQHTKNQGGFMGLYKGLFARIIMIGTLTGLQWFIYDTTKVAFGLEAGGKK